MISGIYVDGPNIDRGLYDAKEDAIIRNVGSIIREYAESIGEIAESYVFIDENTQWRNDSTKTNYECNSFKFIESKAFRYFTPGGGYAYGKSLTDPAMYCFIIDRLHDEDCPDMFIIVSGDKDITVPLEYIKAHGKKALIIGESNTMSGYLISRCSELGFSCHSLQLISHISKFTRTETKIIPSAEKKHRKTPNKMRPNQMNPNNTAYWRSRGFEERPDDWEEILKKEKLQ